MKFLETEFSDLYLIETDTVGDERGWFMRTFDEKLFYKNIPNFNSKWVQMNQSFNKEKYTWRGFHFQEPPYQETKVVRCISGSIIDCVLDIRKYSSSFLKVFTTELTAQNKKMLYIPKGFAHGFFTQTNDTEVVYLHDEFYNQKFEKGILFNDNKINFDLKFQISHISERDKNHITLTEDFKGY